MLHLVILIFLIILRGGSRASAASKMEHFVIIVNGWKYFVITVSGWKLLTIITKSSILDVAAVLDPPLILILFQIISGKEGWDKFGRG